jgi:hypothetical protein
VLWPIVAKIDKAIFEVSTLFACENAASLSEKQKRFHQKKRKQLI